ncbi:zinc finger and SCAN domain-containing protein 22-like [Topomyia yanbarensis]|uniref:zinc finger and SCAN domain-containing protein 22-like n=1 Tax=Topomyia yanbarensis TaxID=2498891 RepID=UPI00273AABC0|nr:zinc finger and SCAN domain-containing protein 22-like [Topomyia yanbarensis]
MKTVRRSRRNTRKIKSESSFDLVDANLKPRKPDITSSLPAGNSEETISSNRTKWKSRKSRAIQVTPDDIDETDTTSPGVPIVSGENEPIDPGHGEPITPQCRFCLRRVSRANLKIILPKHKPKALAALKIKIFPGDAYPFACCNCLNLIEIILDFKSTVSKAKYLLLDQRMYLESEGWDDEDCTDAISKCRTVVEQHKNQIDLIHEEAVNRKEYELKNDSLADGFDQVDDLGDLQCETTIGSGTPEQMVEPVQDVPAEEATEENESTMHSSDGGSEDSDYEPPSDSQDEDYGTALRKSKKLKKANAKNDEKRPESGFRGELCDLCGQRVSAQAAESHKNRHLGIKPYKCPSEGCELTFYSRVNQISHVQRIHGENGVPVHKCDICGRHIRGTLKVINYHKRTHEQKKEHVCQFCGKGFTMRQYLKQHVTVVHTEVFPHKCSYCGKKFKLKWSMLAHEKNVHEKKFSAGLSQEQQSSNYETPQDISIDYA